MSKSTKDREAEWRKERLEMEEHFKAMLKDVKGRADVSSAYFPLGGKFLSQKSPFVWKHDSARKLNGFLLLNDVALPQANQMAGRSRCERNIPPSGNLALVIICCSVTKMSSIKLLGGGGALV